MKRYSPVAINSLKSYLESGQSVFATMEEDPNGEFVKHTDIEVGMAYALVDEKLVELLEKQVEDYKRLNEVLQDMLRNYTHNHTNYAHNNANYGSKYDE